MLKKNTFLAFKLPDCYAFKMIYFICNGGVGTASQPAKLLYTIIAIHLLCHGDTIIMSCKNDKHSLSLADVNVSPPRLF